MSTKSLSTHHINTIKITPCVRTIPNARAHGESEKENFAYAQQLAWLENLKADHLINDNEYSRARQMLTAKFHRNLA